MTSLRFSPAPGPLLLFTFLACCLALPSRAYASRVVSFSGAATTTINDTQVLSKVYPECQIMITNVGSIGETISVVFNVDTTGLLANSGGSNPAYNLTVTLNGSALYNSTISAQQWSSGFQTLAVNGNPGDTLTIDWITAGIPKATQGTQNLACFGTITVTDTTTGSPGFVSASGTITTFNEVAAGVSMTTAAYSSGTANPSVTPIVIGEGRPF